MQIRYAICTVTTCLPSRLFPDGDQSAMVYSWGRLTEQAPVCHYAGCYGNPQSLGKPSNVWLLGVSVGGGGGGVAARLRRLC